ncbi:MAG: hypothetical protein HY054_11435 [Proteobacteria bacterium]|nr:hypothetical protein [Pseudomonadota bacterium]
MKLFVRIVLGLLFVVALIVGGLVWWLDQEARGPALANGMGWPRDCCNVDSPYDARLRQTFPAGSSERRLREVLARQGFEFRPDRREAVAHWSSLACSFFASVEWEADDAERVTAISGDTGSACL